MASIIKNVVSTGSIKITMNISEKSYSVADNTSVVEYSIVLSGTGSLSVSNAKSLSVVINGTKVFNSTVNVTKSSGASKTLASGTTTVNHDNDGSKTVSFSFTQSFSGISWGGSGTFYSSVEGSGTLSLTTIPRASSISVSSGSATKPGNGTIVLSISRASSSFTHTVTWSCGNLNGTVGTGLATSASWSVPLSLIEQSPNGNQTVTFTCTTYNGSTSIGSHSCTATVGFHSPSTISSQSGNTLGSTMSFTIERSHQNLTHSLWYSFGSKTWQGIASSAGTSASFTPPLSLCSEIPNATSGSMTIILRTYYGSTQIGSDQYKYYTMNVPASVIPSFTEISCVEAVNEVSTLVGAYVQNKSRLTLGIIGASGSYGSTIQSYKIEVAGQTIHSQSGTTGLITQCGELTIEATITDSRGRSSSKSTKITVLAYYLPYFSNIKIIRDGVKAIIAGNGACVSLRNANLEKNTFWYKIECKEKSSSVWKTVASVNTSVIAYSLNVEVNDLDEGKSYDFRLYAGDVFVWSSPYLLAVSTAFKAFDFDVINGRLGIKKVLEHVDSAIEYPDGYYIYSGDNKVLTEKGGIMQKGCLSHSANAGSGSNGYVKVATIVDTGTHQNSPIEFKIFRRGTIRPTMLYLQFSNAGTNDPSISSFSYVGASCNAYIIKTSTGIFDLYIQKSEGYDNIAILLTYNYIYMSGIDIQWKNEFVSSIPSGATQANVIT